MGAETWLVFDCLEIMTMLLISVSNQNRRSFILILHEDINLYVINPLMLDVRVSVGCNGSSRQRSFWVLSVKTCLVLVALRKTHNGTKLFCIYRLDSLTAAIFMSEMYKETKISLLALLLPQFCTFISFSLALKWQKIHVQSNQKKSDG